MTGGRPPAATAAVPLTTPPHTPLRVSEPQAARPPSGKSCSPGDKACLPYIRCVCWARGSDGRAAAILQLRYYISL